MKFIPPSPSRIPEAFRFVKDIPRPLGVTDFQAVINAGVGQLAVSLMFFSWMFSSIYKFTIPSTVIAVFSGTLALLCVISGIRTLNLLNLFPNTDLPESLLEGTPPESECSFGKSDHSDS
jgi:hypothetical protein